MLARLAITLLALFACSALRAAPTAYRCNSCTSTGYYNTALARAQAGQLNSVYVYDFANANLKRFSIEREPMSGGWQYTILPMTIPPAVLDHFDAAQLVWQATNGQMKAEVVINPGSSPSGSPQFPSQVTSFINTNNQGFYGIVTTPQIQTHLVTYVQAWVTNYIGIPGDPAAASVNDILQLDRQLKYDLSPDVMFVAKVQIPGGGSATFTLTDTVAGAGWRLVSLIDRSGIAVPLNPSDVSPTNGSTRNYNFTQYPGDMQSFMNYLVYGMNVPVVYVGGWTVACVRAGGQSHCSAHPN